MSGNNARITGEGECKQIRANLFVKAACIESGSSGDERNKSSKWKNLTRDAE